MLDHPIAQENHHLAQVLALGAYAESHVRDPEGAKRAVCQAFGLVGDLNDDLLLCIMLLLSAGRFADAKPLLLQIGLAAPEKIPALYAVTAAVFKYFNAGMTIRELAEFGIDLVLPWYQQHPGRIEAQQALLDLLLYFGLANDAENILNQAANPELAAEAAELACYRERLQHDQNRCKLSIVMITYQRPEMLRHTLQGLHAALAETDIEIIIGVNDDWAATRQVISEAGITQVLYHQGNAGINLYKQVFPMAGGEYLIEIDDDVVSFPAGFDRQIIDCLHARPDLGLVGHWPQGFVDCDSGQRLGAAESFHTRCEVAGLPFGIGPVAGVCAGMRRRDFLTINGFSRATLSKYSGEEPQLIRKLAVYGKLSGVIFDQGLQVYVSP